MCLVFHMPRLVNAPLHPAVVSVKRFRALRDATTSYCTLLYERAYKQLEYREHMRALHTQRKANFERDAALIRRRVLGLLRLALIMRHRLLMCLLRRLLMLRVMQVSQRLRCR